MRSSRHHWIGTAVVVTVMTLPGCGGSGGSAPEVEQAAPRFPTARALTDHINSTMQSADSDIASVGELLDVYYAETDVQRQIQGMFDNVRSVLDLLAQAQQRFPSLAESMAGNDSRPPMGRIMRDEGQRVYVEFNDNGDVDTMQLVQVGDEWWVSGYTFEHDPDFQQMIAEGKLPQVQAFANSVGAQARTLQGRLSAGEFSTEDEFGAALLGAMFGVMGEHADMAEMFENLPLGGGGPGFGGG